MRPKSRRKFVYHLTYQDSKKILCPECTKSIFSDGTKQTSKKAEYKSLCKSAKCLIHKNKPKLEKISAGKLLESKVLQRITSGRKFRVREFEEHRKYQVEINPTTFHFVEAMVEEVGWEDVKFETFLAQGFVKEAITRTVVWPLSKPKVFKGLRSAPTGVLLFGPTGVGKAIMGKYIAFQIQASFFNLPASVLTSKYTNNNENFIKALFLVAKARQPSIIFIDEVETLFSHKAPVENEFIRKIKNEFFLCMDSADRDSNDRILIIGATKKPFDLDDEIIVRFSKRFFISLPDKAARKGLLEKLLECECHSLEYCDIEELANKTEGYTAGEIKNLSQEAAMSTVMTMPAENFDRLELTAIKPISITDFVFALRMVKPNISKEELNLYENWDNAYGYGGQCARKLGAWSVMENGNYEQQSSYIT